MNTEMIATLANRGQIATADFHLNETLRYEVIPEFFSMLPESVWRRRNQIVAIPYNVLGPYDLADDFYSMVSVHLLPPTWPQDKLNLACLGEGLIYIGEEPEKVAAARAALVPGKVTGYFIDVRDDGQMKGLMTNTIPDVAQSYSCTYIAFPYFANAAQSVDMNQYIPEPFQQGLIKLLRANILADRYGEGDQRAQGAMAGVQQAIDLAMHKYALARRNHEVYVR